MGGDVLGGEPQGKGAAGAGGGCRFQLLMERGGDKCQLLAGRMSGKQLNRLQEGREQDSSRSRGSRGGELLGSELGGTWGRGGGVRTPLQRLRHGAGPKVEKGGWGWQAGSRDVLGKGEMQQELRLGQVPAPPQHGVGVRAAPWRGWLSPAPLLGEEVWELGELSHA